MAVSADIEAMFYQEQVDERDCDALRFIWWDSKDHRKGPVILHMAVRVFGGVGSLACVAFVLR